MFDPPTRVHEYPRTHTRGIHVPATGTGMRRVGYGFEKKNRLLVPAVPVYLPYPCPPYPPPAAGVPSPYPRYPPANHYLQGSNNPTSVRKIPFRPVSVRIKISNQSYIHQDWYCWCRHIYVILG
jgi:hypothetical protein